MQNLSPKPINKVGVYRRLLSYLLPYKAIFVVSLVCMIVFGASDGAVPFLVKYILDQVFTHKQQDLLYYIPLMLLGFGVIRALADFGQQYLLSKIGHNIVGDIRNNLSNHLLKLEPGFFVNNRTAQVMSVMGNDVLMVRSALTEAVAAMLRDSVRIIALMSAAFYLDSTLALIAFVAFPLGIYPVYRFGRKIRKLSRKGQETTGNLNVLLQESMLGSREVRLFSREPHEQKRFVDENQSLQKLLIKSEKNRALTGPVNEILAMVAISAVVLYGGWSVIGGERTQGDFIAFLLSVFLLYDPFKRLSKVNATIQQSLASAERIFTILDTAPKVENPKSPAKLTGSNSIKLKAVSVRYAEDKPYALKDINLEIAEGEKIALVGFSGAGKSTLVDLIPRFLDPTEGSVSLGNVDLRTVTLEELRGRISMVGQSTFLFNDSVYNNIAYGNPKATKDQIYQAAKAAHALEFIEHMPQGFETSVGEGGRALSGGERQRISIARAILKNSPIIIFDEATASLDNKSERLVQSAIEELARNKTTIVIAHRLSTIQNADRIVVMSEGQIVEVGTHSSLMANPNGAYAKLHALQFSKQVA